MSELVAYEVQIAFAAQGVRDQANHLVQGDAPLHDGIQRLQDGHVRVHGLVHQPKGDGLVTHQSLIMRFRVANVFFQTTPG